MDQKRRKEMYSILDLCLLRYYILNNMSRNVTHFTNGVTFDSVWNRLFMLLRYVYVLIDKLGGLMYCLR